MQTIEEQLQAAIVEAQAKHAEDVERLGRAAEDASIDEIVLSFMTPASCWLDDWSELGRLVKRGLRGLRFLLLLRQA